MKTLLLTGCLWMAAHPLPSDELRRERLPADVDFVMHFDLEGFKRTELWQHIQTETDQNVHMNMDDLDEFKARYGIDPLTDIRAVTLYKVESEEDPTVVLFSTSKAVEEALVRFQAEGAYQKLDESGIELHSWAEGDLHDDTVFAYLHKGANDEHVVVLAGNKESALRAARVLRGEEPNHLKSESLLEIAPAAGSFLYVAARGLPHMDADDSPASQVFGLAQGIQVDLGEAGGFLQAHMGIATGSKSDAADISNVVNGLVSLARLAGGEYQELIEVLGGLSMRTEGSKFVIDFEFGVRRLAELSRELDQMDW